MKYTIFNGEVFAHDEDQLDLMQDRINLMGHSELSEHEAIDMVSPPLVSAEYLLEVAKGELRSMRAPMLDALTGIAGRSARAGNGVLAAEADTLAEQLLDITDDPALNAATTLEAMQAAGMAAYRRIASEASHALASVFKEITGA